MALGFAIVDSSDNVLFDLNSSTGTGNPNSIKTFIRDVDLGAPSGNPQFFNPSTVPGGSRTNSKDELVTASWLQSFTSGTSPDAFRESVSELLRLLRDGGIIKVTPPSGTAFYIDYIHSPLAAMLRGQNIGSVKLYSQFHDPEGMPLSVVRQPYFRRSEPGLNYFTPMSTLVEDSTGDGIPDGWAWSGAGTPSGHVIDSITESYQVDIAGSGASYFSRGALSIGSSGETWTLSADVRRVSGAGSIGLVLAAYTAGSVFISQTLSSVHSSATWTRISVTMTMPATTAKIDPRFLVNDAGQFQMRRIKLAWSATDTEYSNHYAFQPAAVANDPGSTSATGFGRAFPVFIQGSAPAPVQFSITGDSGAAIQRAQLAVRSSYGTTGKNYLADYLNTTKVFQCESGTLGGNTTSVADADASSGNVAQVALSGAGGTGPPKRVRVSRTTKLDSLRGSWNVILRCKHTGSLKTGITLKWGASTLDPCPITEPEIIHDTMTNGLSTYDYVDLNLGQIYIPEVGTLSGVAMEVWARKIDGSGSPNLNLDCLILVPAQLSSVLDVPYVQKLSRLGKDLDTTAGTDDGNSVVLNANGEQAQLDFEVPAAGRYRVSYRYSIQGAGASTDLRFRAGTYTAPYAIGTITPTVDHHETGALSDATNVGYAIEFDANGTSRYTADARLETADGATATIHEVTWEFIPVVSQDQVLYTDPTDVKNPEAWKKDSSGQRVVNLDIKGPPVFWMPPGLNIFYLSVYEPIKGGLYQEMYSKLTRAPTVSYSYSPRDYA